jgi:putative transposase
VKTTGPGGPRGYAGAKQVKGRKCPLLVGTLGLVLLVVVPAANVQDRQGARPLLVGLATQLRRQRRMGAEGAYVGELENWTRGLPKWGKLRREIIRKPKGQNGFAVLPWRWRVERTLAWLGRNRRLQGDYERLPQTTEARIYVARIRLTTRRLAAS